MKTKQINRCHNCKYAGKPFRAYYTTYVHCYKPEYEDMNNAGNPPSSWETLRVFSSNCDDFVEKETKKTKEMKTEPTELNKKEPVLAVNHMVYWTDEGKSITTDVCYKWLKIAFKEGQSNPKIKQLEWVEVNGLGEIGIEAKTPFGNYEVYEKSDHDGYILWWFDPKPYVFDTEIEAKMYAQADFERRVRECLD